MDIGAVKKFPILQNSTTFQDDFNDIEIDGTNISSSDFYPVEEDYAEIYRSDNDVTIVVDK